jgi:DNA-binding SARP family transcriptional activator
MTFDIWIEGAALRTIRYIWCRITAGIRPAKNVRVDGRLREPRDESWETDMRYATQTDADLKVFSPGRAAKSFARGAGHSPADGSATGDNKLPIRIFALGRFNIAIDGWELRSNGKARHRPLGLLKALISLGGRGVAASRLSECLWPDSDGDLGARNLSITLHRLRSVLQTRSAVLSDNGRLSLNEAICWVDAWEFERLVNEGLDRIKPGMASESEAHLRAALRLYAGHLLASESEECWMLAPRLRLKTKFERLVAALSTHLEQQTRFADATDTCLQALELDPLNELLYRRLMSCYLKRNELASVLAIYRRCREILAKELSAPVSFETERLYREALQLTRQGVTQTGSLSFGAMYAQPPQAR